MNLLPKTHQEFSSTDYWDYFFKKRGSKAFEWYGEYPELADIIHKYAKTADNVLQIGCGNSRLSEDLYDIGYKAITNIDISDVVIKQMTSRNAQRRPNLVFQKMDMLKMEFSDKLFSVIIDKGTLDALMTDDSETVQENASKMFAEVQRVLKMGGRYMCITLAQEHILHKLLDHFANQGWLVRVHKVMEAEESDKETKEFQMPVFVFVCTKFRKSPAMPQILEECVEGVDKFRRFENTQSLMAAVKEKQQYAMLRQSLNRRNHMDEDIVLDLYSPDSPVPRYSLYVVDSAEKNSAKHKFAIFIVPQGRESEWLFSSWEGRRQLAGSAGFQRLVVVCLSRDHQYGHMDEVKGELNAKVMELAPSHLQKNSMVPFLSVGSDIGQRKILKKDSSQFSGEYVVEDVECDNHVWHRHLIFLQNKNTIQSEARLKTERKRKGNKSGKKRSPAVIDHSYLPSQYFKAVVLGLSYIKDIQTLLGSGLRILLVGLGGGGIPMFLHTHYPQVHIDVVELDPDVVKIAKEWFGFLEDKRMRVHVGDGLEFLQQLVTKGEKELYDVVIFDVDNKDVSIGLSCPPREFVENDVLNKVVVLLKKSGVFILNLACRNEALRQEVVAGIKSVFPVVCIKGLEGDVNQVLYCLPATWPLESKERLLKSAAYMLERQAQHVAKTRECLLDAAEMLNSLDLAK